MTGDFKETNWNKSDCMDEERKNVEQPSVDLQQLLDDVLSAEPEKVVFMGRKRTIGWLHNGTVRKFTHVCLKEKNEWKKSAKLCAVVLLNGCFRLRLLYWLYWRWLYYVKDPDAAEMLRVVNAAKKKIPSVPCSLLTILATGMTDAMMTMTTAEARATRAGQAGEQRTR